MHTFLKQVQYVIMSFNELKEVFNVIIIETVSFIKYAQKIVLIVQ